MILFVDDLRLPPNDGKDRMVARSYQDALDMIVARKPFDKWELDHDLGEEKTAYDLIKHVANFYPEKMPSNLTCHSANPIGRENILSYWECWKRNKEIADLCNS